MGKESRNQGAASGFQSRAPFLSQWARPPVKTTLQLALVFVVGLAGGLLGSTLLGGGGAVRASDSASELTESSPEAQLRALEERMTYLERSAEAGTLALGDLETRMLALSRRETGPAAAAPAAGGAGDPAAGLDLASMPTGAGFDAAVVAAVERREEAERLAREAERAQRREERVKRTADELAAELGLDGAQKDAITRAMLESTAAREAFFEGMRESGTFDREGARQVISDIRSKELAAAGAVLNESQLQRYSEATDFGRGFGGRDGGGGGGNRDTGRGGF